MRSRQQVGLEIQRNCSRQQVVAQVLASRVWLTMMMCREVNQKVDELMEEVLEELQEVLEELQEVLEELQEVLEELQEVVDQTGSHDEEWRQNAFSDWPARQKPLVRALPLEPTASLHRQEQLAATCGTP